MERKKTRAEFRAELAKDLERFVEDGGKVRDVDRGVSGRFDTSKSLSAKAPFEPKKERTSIDDVVKELDERKQQQKGQKKSERSARRRSGPRKKLLKDDFGEPIRWVWED